MISPITKIDFKELQERRDHAAIERFEKIIGDRNLLKTRDRILSQFVGTAVATHTSQKNSGLTIGIEQEFFLLTASGSGCTYSQSQEFLRIVAQKKGYDAIYDNHSGDLVAVAIQLDNNKYAKIKYELSPHLLEVSASFDTDLNKVYSHLSTLFEVIEDSSKALGLSVSFQSFIDPDKIVEDSFKTYRKDLFNSRKYFARNLNPEVSDEIIKFPAYTASTQIHLGGLTWWNDPQLIDKLYCIEPQILHLITNQTDISIADIRARHELYSNCFPGVILVGFPAWKKWNIHDWATGLLTSPPVIEAEPENLGKALFELPMKKQFAYSPDLYSLRDFQIIRPRLFGTLEFRAMGSCSNLSQIMIAAALRLAAGSLIANQTYEPKNTFEYSRSIWLEMLTGNTAISQSGLKSKLEEELKRRNLGEERFLK